MDLSNKVFELIENEDGLAASKTKMVFDNSISPYRATYSGDNVHYGNAIVSASSNEISMLYQALTKEGELVAGKAKVYLTSPDSQLLKMQLHWQWLTGDMSSGISHWCEIDA